jgi:flavin-binding protein dodecin
MFSRPDRGEPVLPLGLGRGTLGYSDYRESAMAVARVTEITSASEKSFDDALRIGIARANKTLKNVRGAWVKQQKVTIDKKGKISEYRVTLKVTFVLVD